MALQQDDPTSLLNHYRELVHLRNEHTALRTGDFVFIETDSARVYAFIRSTDEEQLLILINFDDEPVSDYVLSLPEGNLNNGEPILLFGNGAISELITNVNSGFDAYIPLLELPAQSTFVIQLP